MHTCTQPTSRPATTTSNHSNGSLSSEQQQHAHSRHTFPSLVGSAATVSCMCMCTCTCLHVHGIHAIAVRAVAAAVARQVTSQVEEDEELGNKKQELQHQRLHGVEPEDVACQHMRLATTCRHLHLKKTNASEKTNASSSMHVCGFEAASSTEKTHCCLPLCS